MENYFWSCLVAMSCFGGCCRTPPKKIRLLRFSPLDEGNQHYLVHTFALWDRKLPMFASPCGPELFQSDCGTAKLAKDSQVEGKVISWLTFQLLGMWLIMTCYEK